MGKTILIIDDDPISVDELRNTLMNYGYKVICILPNEDAFKSYNEYNPDLIIIEIIMPQYDALNICKQIRISSNIPIIMISSNADVDDIVSGLDSGADDYIIKPYFIREVTTRVKAVLRRTCDLNASYQKKRVEIHGMVIDLNKYETYINGNRIPLTKKEIEILWKFATNPGRVFTRDSLLEDVWGYEYFGNTRTVDTHIKRIRTKLSLDNNINFDIKTVWGVGYKFEIK